MHDRFRTELAILQALDDVTSGSRVVVFVVELDGL